MEQQKRLQAEIAFLRKRLEALEMELQYVESYGLEQNIENEPQCLTRECSSTPEQTATGKESTNPLMVASLPKAVKDFSENPPKDFLRPNMGIQIPRKNEEQSSPSSQEDLTIQMVKKDYYVVYNGPNAGIYDHWSTAKQATEKVPGIQHKKFRNFHEARISADMQENSRNLYDFFLEKWQSPKALLKPLLHRQTT
ncbi:uncharacterized protein LOC141656698 [Silene latifolia]|uniref:uncharacterized protein LOC141656698 n=1 Tax=Silene latifolia TaxID=37657 RepID=UPI003D76E460